MQHPESSGNHHPSKPALSAEMKACLDACRACTVACLACAKACATEKDAANLQTCIRLDQDCASVCTALGDVLARGAPPNADMLDALLGACIASCGACAKECDMHGKMGMAHCAACAEACRTCESACQKLKGVAQA